MFVLPRVSSRTVPDPSSLESLHSMPGIKSEPLCSNVYSRYERSVLIWLNKQYEKYRKIVWKDSQRGDIILSLCSFCWYSFCRLLQLLLIEILWQLATESIFLVCYCLSICISFPYVSVFQDQHLLISTVHDGSSVFCVFLEFLTGHKRVMWIFSLFYFPLMLSGRTNSNYFILIFLFIVKCSCYYVCF